MGLLGIIRANKAWERKVLLESLDKLPFAVARSSRATLVEQVAEGLRRAIDSGFYKVGDVLPTTRDLATALGVSRIVTRAAVRELAEAGLINPKPSVGSVVLGRHGKLWRGNVLFISRAKGWMYYANVFTATLRTRLVKAGWLFTHVAVEPSVDGKVDVSELELQLTHPVTLAVVLFDNPVAERILSRSGVPFVTIGDVPSCRLKGCVGHVRYDRSAAAAEIAKAAVETGVKTAVQVGCADFDDIGAALKVAGIRTTRWTIPIPKDGILPMAVSFAARDAFAERLAGRARCPQRAAAAWGQAALPDLVYFSDDYLCVGALAAFVAAGIRVPDDVRVVTWANSGNGPFYAKELTRTEMDPQGDADKIATAVLARLENRPGDLPPTLGPVFRRGATL